MYIKLFKTLLLRVLVNVKKGVVQFTIIWFKSPIFIFRARKLHFSLGDVNILLQFCARKTKKVKR